MSYSYSAQVHTNSINQRYYSIDVADVARISNRDTQNPVRNQPNPNVWKLRANHIYALFLYVQISHCELIEHTKGVAIRCVVGGVCWRV